MKDKCQIAITLLVVLTYIYLVVVGKAHVEGFVALSLYVIKKALDMIEKKEK